MSEVLDIKENRSEIIEKALKERGSTKRWLAKQLEEYDIFLADSMLSNRFQGRYNWKKEELKAINKILKLRLKVD